MLLYSYFLNTSAQQTFFEDFICSDNTKTGSGTPSKWITSINNNFSVKSHKFKSNCKTAKSSTINIYPNPSKGLINIVAKEKFSYKIYNNMRNKVSESNLNKGVYYIKMIFNTQTVSKKIIIN